MQQRFVCVGWIAGEKSSAVVSVTLFTFMKAAQSSWNVQLTEWNGNWWVRSFLFLFKLYIYYIWIKVLVLYLWFMDHLHAKVCIDITFETNELSLIPSTVGDITEVIRGYNKHWRELLIASFQHKIWRIFVSYLLIYVDTINTDVNYW